jgi:hypothetical protein
MDLRRIALAALALALGAGTGRVDVTLDYKLTGTINGTFFPNVGNAVNFPESNLTFTGSALESQIQSSDGTFTVPLSNPTLDVTGLGQLIPITADLQSQSVGLGHLNSQTHSA